MADVIYVLFAENGNIRKWAAEPFEGGEPYRRTPSPLDDEAVVERVARANIEARGMQWHRLTAFGEANALREARAAIAAVPSFRDGVEAAAQHLDAKADTMVGSNIAETMGRIYRDEAAAIRALLPSTPGTGEG